MTDLEKKLFAAGPKRILSLDGGGVRGMLTLGYLEKIERIFRERFGRADLTLADYFDLIGGTSTGAILAAGLAKGYSVSRLQSLYQELSNNIFKRRFWRQGIIFAKFAEHTLRSVLNEHFEGWTLGDSRLKCGLVIVTKRWDTGSPWVMHNNPRGTFFDSAEEGLIPNKDYQLTDVIRASTAAPSLFRPEFVDIAPDQTGAFVDGGVSPHNNPVLLLLLFATLRGYRLQWPLAEDKLLLVSAGKGTNRRITSPHSLAAKVAMINGLTSLKGLLDDCDALNQTILQWMSHTPTSWVIDREIGDLADDNVGNQPLLSYLRYDVILDTDWLKKNLGLSIMADKASRLARIDEPRNLRMLAEIGESAARLQIKEEHFPVCFDIKCRPKKRALQ